MTKNYIILVLCFTALLACATPAPRVTDHCLAYNQGMRITSNREWPAAVGRAEGIKGRMRLESISISTEGPAEYDRLARDYKAALAPAIRNAGVCYEGSLFQSIVVRMTLGGGEIAELAEREKTRWRESEEKRVVREAAVANLPSDLKRHRLGDVEVELLALRAPGNTLVKLRLTNVSEGRIVKPVTGRTYGFDADSPEIGGVAPTGFSLSDNFGNEFSLRKISPSRLGHSDRGLYPQKSEIYEIIFVGYPPTSASEVTLTIERRTFGNDAEYRIVLPRDVFLP
jgi:hypothetical protein